MAIHLQNFYINHFRGINNLKLEDLNHINIITGDNNAGKTSVLEVINYLSGIDNLRNLIYGTKRLSRRTMINDLSEYEKLSFLFPANDCFNNIIEYSFILNGNPYNITITKKDMIETLSRDEINHLLSSVKHGALTKDSDEFYDIQKMHLNFKINNTDKSIDFYELSRTRYSSDDYLNLINTIYISPYKHSESILHLSEVFNNPDLYEEMLEILKEFDKGILSINRDNFSNQSNSYVYTILSKEHNKAIPLNYYGDGMKKAVLLMSSVITAKNGILLLDEFETAIHTSAMNNVFKWILDTCIKLNIQLFLTSHSKEAIEKVLKCSDDLTDHINLYTLYKKDNQNFVRKLSGQEAIEVNDNLGLELR